MTESSTYDDPFSVGQLVGIMVVLTYIENNGGMPKEFSDKLKEACAEKSGAYLEKPAEDMFLLVESLVGDMKKI